MANSDIFGDETYASRTPRSSQELKLGMPAPRGNGMPIRTPKLPRRIKTEERFNVTGRRASTKFNRNPTR